MLKLFRCIGVEHSKLWRKGSAVFCVVFSAVIAVCASILILISLNSGEFYDTAAASGVTGKWLIGELSDDFFKSREQEEALDAQENQAEYAVSAPIGEIPSGSDVTPTNEAAVAEKYNEQLRQLDVDLQMAEGAQKLSLERQREVLKRESAIASLLAQSGEKRGRSDVWSILIFCMWLITPLITLIAVGMICDMFAGEFERGTVGLMLCRPATRGKQYTAKLFTALMYTAALFITTFFAALLTCVLTVSSRSDGQYIGCVNGKAYAAQWFVQGLYVLLCCFCGAAVCVLLCAAVGNITRSRAAAVSSAAILALVSFYAADIFSAVGVKAFGLSVLSCLDLTSALLYMPYERALSFADCAVSLAVHAIIFAIAGYIAFRRDVE